MKNTYKPLLLPYIKRLSVEAAIKSAAAGAFTASCITAAALIVLHVISLEPPILIIALGFAFIAIAASACFYFARLRPDIKRAAVRTDETGLKERVTTMLALDGHDEYIAGLQRSDALEKLKGASPKNIRFKFRSKPVIMLVCALAVTVGLMFVPYDIMSVFAGEDPTSEAENELITQLIEELRAMISAARVEEDTRAELNATVDALERSIDADDSTLEKAAKLAEAKERIEAAESEALALDDIGRALQHYETTRELGVAIEGNNEQGVRDSLDRMQKRIIDRDALSKNEYLTRINDNIISALAETSVPPTNTLYIALEDFGYSLSMTAADAGAGMDVDDDIEAIIKDAAERIIAALRDQSLLEAEFEQLIDAITAVMNELLGIVPEPEIPAQAQPVPAEGEQAPEQGEPEQEPGDWEFDENIPEDGAGEVAEEVPEEEAGAYMPNEKVYDPDPAAIDRDYVPGQLNPDGSVQREEAQEGDDEGSIPFDEVYSLYYAEILEAIKNGEVPPELEGVIGDYFDSLYD